MVGLVNTARVSAVGWVLSIGFGFLLGILRLSNNPPLRGLVRAGVELMRNVPVLLLLLFLAAAMQTLPAPRAALEPVPGLLLSSRGMVLAYPGLNPGHNVLLILLIAAALLRRGMGRRFALAGLTLAVVASFVISPPVWHRPRLEGFDFVGGLALSPEFAALLAALVLHHAAHISEVVRGAILAVPRGQTDAALALGLSRWQAMRLVLVPQALRAMVPLLISNCVSLAKNSSLAVAIGFPDVVSILNTAGNQTGHSIETMVIMIAVYLGLSLTVAGVLGRYNVRLMERWA